MGRWIIRGPQALEGYLVRRPPTVDRTAPLTPRAGSGPPKTDLQ